MFNLRNLIENRYGRVRILKPAWDDMTFPATRVNLGAIAKPDFDPVEICLLFPQNNPTEAVYVSEQFRHRWDNGSAIHPHIHWLQESAIVPTWKIDYRFANKGEAFSDWVVGVETYEEKYPYESGTIVQISRFPEIDMTGYSTSTIFDFKIYRDDDVLVGDAKFKTFDFHYQIDGFGSSYEFIK